MSFQHFYWQKWDDIVSWHWKSEPTARFRRLRTLIPWTKPRLRRKCSHLLSRTEIRCFSQLCLSLLQCGSNSNLHHPYCFRLAVFCQLSVWQHCAASISIWNWHLSWKSRTHGESCLKFLSRFLFSFVAWQLQQILNCIAMAFTAVYEHDFGLATVWKAG